jgi:membrane protease YdiL (CAAX protease family)
MRRCVPYARRVTPSGVIPPGWYADPWRVATHRWWDGRQWSPWTYGPPPPRERPDPPSPTFSPLGAAIVAGGTVAIILFLRAVDDWLSYRDAWAATAIFYVTLFGGMVGTCALVSRFLGTGSLVRDFGFRVRGIDPAWGIVTLVASFVARIAFVLVVNPSDTNKATDNINDNITQNRGVLAVFLVAALIGAPLFEELVFRGVIQRGLTRVTGKWIAIVTQGVLFGFYHVVGAFELASVLYVGTLSIIGIVFGVAADRTGRLGPTMIAHFLSNAVAMALLLGTDIGR